MHIVFASIWAHWIADAWLAKRPVTGPALAGFLLAALLHGLYVFLVLRHPVAALPIAAAMIGVIWLWRLRLMHRMHEEAARGVDAGQARS